MHDQRPGVGLLGAGDRSLGLRRIRPRTLGQQHHFQRFDVVRQGGGISVHTADRITNADKLVPFSSFRMRIFVVYPAACGRQVCCG
jgi:hypothetical protein